MPGNRRLAQREENPQPLPAPFEATPARKWCDSRERPATSFYWPGQMKTNEQILAEITAAMADAWLAACDRRVIVGTLVPTKFMVIDQRQGTRLFGPASGDECRLFVHRAAALDVLRALGTERVAEVAMTVAGNGELPTLNG
jgi:hypothetical protein